MTAIRKSENHGNTPKNIHPVPDNKALPINPNQEIVTTTALIYLQAATACVLCNPQAYALNPTPLCLCQPIFETTLMISAANGIGEQATEHHPKEV
uniref:Uncharacterized protein n=1 Tax=Romanomermis culicivorax TaxID=13658 RepID=A0A915JTC9_ROMCU